MNGRRSGAERIPGVGFDSEVQHGGESHRAQKAQFIFSETLRRISDRAESAGFEVLAAADEVEHLSFDRIVEKAIDGEIPAFRISFRRGEAHASRMAAVEVGPIGTKGRHLVVAALFDHQNDTELRAYRNGSRKERLHLLLAGQRWRCRSHAAFCP